MWPFNKKTTVDSVGKKDPLEELCVDILEVSYKFQGDNESKRHDAKMMYYGAILATKKSRGEALDKSDIYLALI